MRGAAEPAIVLVEYGDYDCPHTRAAQSVVDTLAREHPDLRVVFRHFPLRHLHANAEILSRLAEAAALQGKFWAMHDHLMTHRRGIDEESVRADAAAVGVDMKRAGQDVSDPQVLARIEVDVQSGKASGVHSTPSFFFDGVLHDGHYDYETLSAKLAQAQRSKRGGTR
jgi:protein-disulfide isomerase